jgi:Flp pilus assembly protein CpaB
LATAAPSRPRPGGGRFFILVGLVLALAAAGGVYLLGSLGGGGVIGGATQTVVVAKNPIPMRHTISKDDLDTLKGVSTNVPNTFTNLNDLVGLIAEVQISKGGIITKDMLAKDIGLVPAGAGPAYLPLAKGYVAMTIPTGEQQGVAGHITSGDYITVIASASLTIFASGKSQPTGPPKVVSKTVFSNIRVIGLGPATSNIQPASGTATVGGTTPSNGGLTSSLTIEITQCDAEFFTWFLNNTQVRYTLESQQDYASTPPTGPDTQNCPNGFDSAKGVSQAQVEARYHFTAL